MTRPAAATGAGLAPVNAPAPIVVLTYPHANDELLTRGLAASPSVVCTRGAGLLPLCQSAMTTWQQVEGRDAGPSALAMTTIRNLVSTMMAVVQSGTGSARWCETAFAGSPAATTFLRIFPDTTFLCLHRSLRAVTGEAVREYPWGLGSSPFWPYSAGHPGNNLATIAAYWRAYTSQLLEFEAAYPRSCLRVRHEDLVAQPLQSMAAIFTRLGLDPGAANGSLGPDAGAAPGAGDARDPHPGPEPPFELIPPQLLSVVSALHEQLGYGSLRP